MESTEVSGNVREREDHYPRYERVNGQLEQDPSSSGALTTVVSVYLGFALIRPQDFPIFDLNFPILAVVQPIILIFWLAQKPNLKTPQHLLLILLALWLPLTLLPLGIGAALDGLTSFLTAVVFNFLFIATVAQNADSRRRLIGVMALSTSVIAVHCILMSLSADGIGFSGQTILERNDGGYARQARYVGIFGDPNDTGMILVLMMPLLMLLRQNTAGMIKLLFSLAMVGHAWALYLTNSRGSFVAIGAVLITHFALKYNIVRGLIVAALLAPIALALAPSRLSISGDESSQTRIDAWYDGFQMFKWNPILGVGMDQFPEHHYRAAHSSWIQAFSETGLVGYFLWAGVILSAFYYAYFFLLQDQEKARCSNNISNALTTDSRAIFLSFVGATTAMMFLSRAYHLPIYILCAFVAGEYLRRKSNGDPLPPRTASMIFASAFATISLVYVIVRIQT